MEVGIEDDKNEGGDDDSTGLTNDDTNWEFPCLSERRNLKRKTPKGMHQFSIQLNRMGVRCSRFTAMRYAMTPAVTSWCRIPTYCKVTICT